MNLGFIRRSSASSASCASLSACRLVSSRRSSSASQRFCRQYGMEMESGRSSSTGTPFLLRSHLQTRQSWRNNLDDAPVWAVWLTWLFSTP